jgi:cytoskeletal protein CcmA (bactofilin family)
MPAESAGVIGKGIRVKGVLRGGEDLIIQGQVQGTISLKENHLVLERSASINAQLEVKNVTIEGQMNGNTEATDKVEVKADARVQGDIRAPRLVMEEGAKFRGKVDMKVDLPPGLLDEPPVVADTGWGDPTSV